MKTEKWEPPAHHNPQVWIVKLMEELGEVGEAYRHFLEHSDPHEYEHMLEEIRHVRFIADCALADLGQALFLGGRTHDRVR